MHSVVIEMKSVQQYFLHYGPILFFQYVTKRNWNYSCMLSFANVRVDIHFALQENIFHQRTTIISWKLWELSVNICIPSHV